MLLVVGSYREANLPGIYIYRLTNDKKYFELVSEISGIQNPSYVATCEQEKLILAISEDKEGSKGQLNIYQLCDTKKEPKLFDVVHFVGAGSCHISVDKDKQHALIANYGGGALTIVNMPKQGVLATLAQQVKFEGEGPNVERQEQSHIHATLFANNGNHLYCTDLGADRIYRFIYNPDEDVPLYEKPQYINLPPGSGPRHLACSGRWLYVITELSGKIFVFDTNGSFDGWIQEISLVEEGFKGEPEAADIEIDARGNTLYATLRGEINEIVVFKVDPTTGTLSLNQRIGTMGSSPRSLLICEEEGLLSVANEKGNNVAIFKISKDGRLEFTGQQLQLEAPSCLKKMRS